MKYVALYADNHGISHFKEVEVEFELVNFAPQRHLLGFPNTCSLVDQFFSRRLPAGTATGIRRPNVSFSAAFQANLKSQQAMAKCESSGEETYFSLKMLQAKATRVGPLEKKILWLQLCNCQTERTQSVFLQNLIKNVKARKRKYQPCISVALTLSFAISNQTALNEATLSLRLVWSHAEFGSLP